jgi:16S rRNA (guanine(966)-N(2))-methyltransferase RsmD/pantetheine-phosphate adenylyltransferase
MRIIAGKYRGKRLKPPADDNVRPTTDRIKETVFNIIQWDIEGAVVLDLFAGSGALGIECLSRGAAEAVFVDKSRESIELVKHNLQGIDARYSVVAGDFSGALRGLKNYRFDLVFIDPPYASKLGGIAVKAVIDSGLLAPNGTVIYEHGTGVPFETENENYKTRTKAMGSVTVEFIKRKTTGLLTGSFDPITVGHEALIKAALEKYDKIVVACLINPEKTYAFDSGTRLEMAEAVADGFEGVSALYSEKTAVEVAAEKGADALIRGLRSGADFGYEKEMAEYNEKRGFKTDFFELDEYTSVSSTSAKAAIEKGDFSLVPKAAVGIAEAYMKNRRSIKQ